MKSDSEKTVIRSYMQNLFNLLKERSAVEKKMQDLETSIRSILALHEDEDAIPHLEQLYDLIPPEGFTDAIKKVLRSSETALTPAEIKEKLPSIGFSLEGYSNPLASIHTILKRLAKHMAAKQVMKDSKLAYRWCGVPTQPLGNNLSMLRDLLSKPLIPDANQPNFDELKKALTIKRIKDKK